MASLEIRKMNTDIPEIDHLLMIYGMANATCVIDKCIELEIFDSLYKEKASISAEDLAKKRGFKSDVLARLLNCLVSLKLVEKIKHETGKVLYSNTKAGALWAKSNPKTVALLPFYFKMLKTDLEKIADRVRLEPETEGVSEEPGKMDMSNFPSMYEMYQGMHNCMAPEAAKLVKHHKLKEHKSCIDLGGGSGVIAFELKRQYPEMDVTVFEMDSVVELLKEKFLPGNEHLGVKFLAGDFFKTPFPCVDLITTSAVLRGFTLEQLDQLIEKCAKAVKPGGAFLAFEQMQSEGRDESVSATIWDLSYELLGGGILTPSQYKTLFTKHGFTDVTITFTQEWNDSDIIYARKGL